MWIACGSSEDASDTCAQRGHVTANNSKRDDVIKLCEGKKRISKYTVEKVFGYISVENCLQGRG